MEVTLQLPENVYRFAEKIASLYKETVESFLSERLEDLIRNIPLSMENGDEMEKMYNLK